jgi:hypothetical protein
VIVEVAGQVDHEPWLPVGLDDDVKTLHAVGARRMVCRQREKCLEVDVLGDALTDS